MYADAVPQRTVHLLILLTPDFSLQRNTTAQKKEKKKIHFFNLCFSSFTGGGVESTATTRIGDAVLLLATLLDLRKQNTLVTTYLSTSSTPKNSTNSTFTSQS
jgi:hypothetical protein